MRVSKQAKAKTNTKIITQAARLFREHGIEATSVTDIMVAAGLTHGGFYRHFASKKDLVITAINEAFDGRVKSLQDNIDEFGARQAQTIFIDMYLSRQHVENAGMGCPIAALGCEVDREKKQYASSMTQGTNRLITLLAQGYDGDKLAARTKATALLSTLVGTIILARSIQPSDMADDILSTGRRLAQMCETLS